jgi:hypothetical protein
MNHTIHRTTIHRTTIHRTTIHRTTNDRTAEHPVGQRAARTRFVARFGPAMVVTAAVTMTVAVLVIVVTPLPALAADGLPLGSHVLGAHVMAAPKSLGEILSGIRTWLMTILAGIATVFLTIGGVRYLMAGGDPAEVERAKSAFKSAGIGYALAIAAPVALTILDQIVGTPQ